MGDLLCSSRMSSVTGCSADTLTRFSIEGGRGNVIRFVETHLTEVLRAKLQRQCVKMVVCLFVFLFKLGLTHQCETAGN